MATGAEWTTLKPALSAPTLSVLTEKLKFARMTSVQERAIPLFLTNKDVVVEARRETPLGRRDVGAVVIEPTRELAAQVKTVVDHFADRKAVTSLLLVGGNTSLEEDVARVKEGGCGIIVATPGRCLEVFNHFGKDLRLKELEVLVLDEADRLLEMGFKATLTAILEQLPKQRRTGLFSATQSDEVGALTRAGTRNPVHVKIGAAPKADQHDVPEQLESYYAIVEPRDKLQRLAEFVAAHPDEKMIIYFITCACVDYFFRVLKLVPAIQARTVYSFHGKAPAAARTKIYQKFVESNDAVLLCTDVAARGLDIPKVDWILQYDPPQDPKMFVHRIGRTARMGNQGRAVVFLTPAEKPYVDFLKLRKVPLAQLELPAAEGIVNVSDLARESAVGDRELFVSSQAAYASFVRGYKEHECSFIFRLDAMDVGATATGMGLAKIPFMHELRGKDTAGFVPVGVDPDTIPFKDAAREQARLAKLSKTQEERRERKEKDIKERQEKRKQRQKEAKEASRPITADEIAEINEEARLIKKRKKGRISEKRLEAALGEEDDSDGPSKKRRRNKKRRC
eukprot:m51a1_g13767 putative atp-dependent rna helicase ddx55 (567) ;mRNA; r:257996-259963